MALNIAITSKYNPLTYEDYIKPLEGYWEDYGKQEAAFDQLSTDVATLRPIIANMADGEEKTKYTNWLNNLEAQANSLQSNGLTTENRKALRDLKASYAALMPRLALAEESRRKAFTEWMNERNSGKYFTEAAPPLELQNAAYFLDGNIPSYSRGISKDEVSKEAMLAAKAFSSKMFNDPTITKHSQAGVNFIKQVEEVGYNADLDDIQNDELLSPILEALYEEYGVDKNATDSKSKAIRDHIAKEFWKGLVYEKQTNYQQYRPTKTDAPYHAIATLEDGNKLIRSGNKHLIIDKDNNLVGEYQAPKSKDNTPPTPTEVKRKNFLSQHVIGFDQYRNSNVGNVHRSGDSLDAAYNSPLKVLERAKNSIVNTSWSENDEFTRVSDIDPAVLFEKSYGEEDTDGTLKYFTPDNTVFFEIGGGARSRAFKDKYGELLGDNHIVGVDIDTILSLLELKENDFRLLNNIYKQYMTWPNSNVASRINAYITEKRNEGMSDENLLAWCADIAAAFNITEPASETDENSETNQGSSTTEVKSPLSID